MREPRGVYEGENPVFTPDVDRGLDLLAAQAQPGRNDPMSHRDYIADFEKRAFGVSK
jgi:hypothetical protein